jgi:hypothetical protein
VLTFEAKVVKRYEEAGEVRVELELLCTKQTGNAVVFGTAIYLVPSAGPVGDPKFVPGGVASAARTS